MADGDLLRSSSFYATHHDELISHTHVFTLYNSIKSDIVYFHSTAVGSLKKHLTSQFHLYFSSEVRSRTNPGFHNTLTSIIFYHYLPSSRLIVLGDNLKRHHVLN